MTIDQSIRAAEAIIFASGDGMTFDALMDVLEVDEKQMQYILDMLKDKYYDSNSGIVLIQNSDIISFTTGKEQSEIVHKALAIKKNSPLSNAAMETLAIIAYNQPVSRAFIEQVRGVDSTSSVQTLLARNLIEEAGRLEIPGRPLSYRTTATFLRSFSLNSLADLPRIKSEKEEGQLSTDDLTTEEDYNDLAD
ncbi:MAG: SMC-Scp complex subunit ScpB [Oscillospiraceae bacterium]|nr:SMC-Scp complex subunit ScpB [Oscillospiraceae bacterium]